MNANAEYLERLKRSGHQKSKQFENGVWGTVSSTVLFAAMIFVTTGEPTALAAQAYDQHMHYCGCFVVFL